MAPLSPRYGESHLDFAVKAFRSRGIKEMLLDPRPLAGGSTATLEDVSTIRGQWEEKVKSARDLAKKAEDEKRQLTKEEKDQIKASLKEADGLAKQLNEIGEELELRKSIEALGEGVYLPVDPSKSIEKQVEELKNAKGFKSFGDQFIDSEAYKNLKTKGFTGKWDTGSVEIKNGANLLELGAFGQKATVTETASPIITPQTVLQTPLPILFRRLVVADLMPSGRTGSNLVRYPKETTATNAAAAIAEGGAKPESTLIFTNVDEPVRKIATTIKISDEMLEDAPQLRTYLDNRLRLFVQLTEEDQLLNGSGAGNNLTGILNRSGVQTQALGTDTRSDAVFKAITLVRTNSFLEPDGMVIHPSDWQDFKLQKDANGQYMGGGPFVGPYGVNGIAGDTYWGMRVVVTPAIAVGTALVGAFGTAAQVFRRNDITVEATNSNEDDFKNNLVALRAEERLALAVYRAAGFCTVTGV